MLGALATVVGTAATVPSDPAALDLTGITAGGIAQSAGLLFFAFAGYARIATLGEEVRDPAVTIPARFRWRWG